MSGFLGMTPKAHVAKGKISCMSEDNIMKVRHIPQNGKKYLQFLHLTGDLHPEI